LKRDLRTLFGSSSKIIALSLTCSVLLFAVVAIQMLFVKFNKRFDFTESGAFSISEQSSKILKGLSKTISIKGFYEKGKYHEVYDQLNKFNFVSRSIKIEMVNIDLHPKLCEDFGITHSGQCVLSYGKRHKRVESPSERNIVSAIVELTSMRKRKILFLCGHGERRIDEQGKEGLSAFSDELEKEYYKVEQMPFVQRGLIEKGLELVVFAGPKKDLASGEVEVLNKYLRSGGKVLLFLDPGEFPLFNRFLEQYGIELRNDIIVDEKNRFITKDKFSPIIPYMKKRIINLERPVPVFFCTARSVTKTNSVPSQVQIEYLLMSGDTSQSIPYGMGRKVDARAEGTLQGPVPVAALVEIGNRKEMEDRGSLIVIGDSDFISNKDIDQMGNKDLVLNMIDWIFKRNELIGIRAKRTQYYFKPLTQSDSKLLFWVSVVIIPGVAFLLGLFFFVRNRLRT